MSFLKAQWSNLALINYDVDPDVINEYLPHGTELDFWNGKCYISLVGFMFENVKLLGIKVPFHTEFEEMNLRFYVKRFENNEWKRGVVFIKEIVPKTALSFVANTFYKEHYETLPMRHHNKSTLNENEFSYSWKKDNNWNSITVNTTNSLEAIEPWSEAEFITEHYFGYTKVSNEKTFEYEVKHPRWEQYKVINFNINVDFKSTYGQDFEFLQHQKPISIILAKGSEVSVENKRLLR